MPGRRSRRALILDAALTLFAEQGYDGTSIAQVAAAVDVSKAAVSFHFPSKELMLRELTEPFLDNLDAVFASHPRHPEWPEGVWRLAGDYLDVLRANRTVAVWVDADKSVHARADIGDRHDETMARLADAIAGGSGMPADRVRAVAAVGGLWRPLRTLGDAELADHRNEVLAAALSSWAPIGPDGGSVPPPTPPTPD